MKDETKAGCCQSCSPVMANSADCINPSCPDCHAHPKETRQEKLERGAEDFANRFEGVMRDLSDHPKTASEDWEEQFDAEFSVVDYDASETNRLKSFIRKVELSARVQGQLNAGYDAVKVIEHAKEEGRQQGQKEALDTTQANGFFKGESWRRGYMQAKEEERERILAALPEEEIEKQGDQVFLANMGWNNAIKKVRSLLSPQQDKN